MVWCTLLCCSFIMRRKEKRPVSWKEVQHEVILINCTVLYCTERTIGEIVECSMQRTEWMRARIILARPNHTYDIRYVHNTLCGLSHKGIFLILTYLSPHLESVIQIVSHKCITPHHDKSLHSQVTLDSSVCLAYLLQIHSITACNTPHISLNHITSNHKPIKSHHITYWLSHHLRLFKIRCGRRVAPSGGV
jgi:hypothetical protein